MTRRRDDLWTWQRRQPTRTPLRDALHRAAGTALIAVSVLAGLWAGPYVHTAVVHERPAEHVAVDVTAARSGEALLERIELETARTGAAPARPGVRPPFIPSAALVVRGGAVAVVPLGVALTERTGRVVGWIR